MQNHFEFLGFKPSVIAAAIIEKARSQLDIRSNTAYLSQLGLDIDEIQICKKILTRVFREFGLSACTSFVSEIPPCEHTKSIGEENNVSNPEEPNEATKPALPPMITLTSVLNSLPKNNKSSTLKCPKRVFEHKTEMKQIILRPQIPAISQSQSISPMKAQLFKLQQKMEHTRNV